MNQANENLDGEDLDWLLTASKEGSASARNELFARLQAYLSYIASRHQSTALRAKAGASDIVQETMLMANREFANFQGTSVEEFRGWLRQILLNEVRSTNRHFSTQARNFKQERELSASSPQDSVGFDLADSSLTPSREVMASEENQQIAAMLGKLPEEMRQVIQLRNWEQLQFNQIADRLGITTSQAAKLWYKALLELQKLYSESEE